MKNLFFDDVAPISSLNWWLEITSTARSSATTLVNLSPRRQYFYWFDLYYPGANPIADIMLLVGNDDATRRLEGLLWPCLSRIRGGDQQAEVELVECYSSAVMSVIRGKVGDIALTDDLYQESFCIILEKVRRGDVREYERAMRDKR